MKWNSIIFYLYSSYICISHTADASSKKKTWLKSQSRITSASANFLLLPMVYVLAFAMRCYPRAMVEFMLRSSISHADRRLRKKSLRFLFRHIPSSLVPDFFDSVILRSLLFYLLSVSDILRRQSAHSRIVVVFHILVFYSPRERALLLLYAVFWSIVYSLYICWLKSSLVSDEDYCLQAVGFFSLVFSRVWSDYFPTMNVDGCIHWFE